MSDTTDVICEDCQWYWGNVHRDEYVRATEVSASHIADGGTCPECGSEDLEVLVPWCPKCEDERPCQCDMTAEEKREQEEWDNMTEAEVERLREEVMSIVRRRMASKDLGAVRQKNREKRSELEAMGAELIQLRFADKDNESGDDQ